ncbi:LIM/homeobox protein Lhx9-like isoform X1 [Vespa mandarinia]|nr:LIM/homeobox protein Lhx9-like isoform X1 [Vespa mandarinia]XP_035732631.1 LIM/homeobox protein Lhx9-like isoform X1 [Vespa mandarinia]XP_046824879.1 LIM/homeobox protein Lhx9-like isoform X3 [Vespa crabro]XP_046824880.1 LIM/homeobox protein Lhx9-like isoform X3 [Vespa crabro]XP_046824881.1 LIM/homeobox protein Lhx9-like isoform X3 [Vespa crabro]XP_046824882.1 LIM/homeobox protein Lhx9-like isoform X3 [Vespa crabro]XP_046824883.1 LIM/homeobox protein Lhx9-like isoform X3 [Vespa crabro]XP_
MLKEVGCGSSTPPAGDGAVNSNRPVGTAESNSSESTLGCGGCGREIAERWYLRAADRAWHCGCLRCCNCRMPLAGERTCFARDGNIYCKEDYYRLFSVSRCSRCREGIFPSELVMRARDLVYHVTCFNCASCGTALNKGDHFGQRDGLVYCRPHYELLCCAGDYGSGTGSIEDIGSPGVSPLPAYYSTAEQSPIASSGTVQKGRPRKRKLSEVTGSELPVTMRLAAGALELLHPTELSSSMESLAAYDASVGSPGPVHQSQRTKRMRTSFKHHQLRTMKNYFAINQNPDAKDLKQLAQKTGLSKRVLQVRRGRIAFAVWFQNARAKWRRNMMRQEGSGANSNVGCPGTPVSSSTAGSPNVAPTVSILGDSNSMPSTSMEELHALHHLHSGVSSQVSFSDLY